MGRKQREHHALMGEVAKFDNPKCPRLHGQKIHVFDYVERVWGKPWMNAFNKHITAYALRISDSGLPMDNEVVLCVIKGHWELVHDSELLIP